MNLEQQVVSLDLSKRLKELGVKQESTFYWYKGYDSWLLHYIDYNHSDEDIKIFTKHNEPNYSAFTVAELGEMLPLWFDSAKRQNGDWVCRVMQKDTEINHHAFEVTEVEARAKMLIFLIENGHIKVEHLKC